MGGTQCSDFSATEVSGVDGLCRLGSGDFEGVVTYTDGRVATLVEPAAGQPAGTYIAPPPADHNRTPIALDLSTDLITRMRELQGIEFGSCSATGFGSSVSSVGFLRTMSGGSPISWSPEDLRALYSALGQTDGQSANAFLCSDGPNRGRVAVNNDGAHMAFVLGAIETFENSCGTLDSDHCEAMLESLRTAAHQDAPQTTWEMAWETLLYVGGLIGVTFAFGVGVPWLQRWLGPRDGGGGGEGGGSGGTRSPLTREAPRAAERASETSETTSSFSAEQGLWAGLATACFVGAAVLVADDATVVGVADDPIAAVAAVAGLAFLGVSALTGEDSGASSGPEA